MTPNNAPASETGDDDLSTAQETAWHGLLATHDAVVRQLDAHLRKRHALSLSAYQVLWRLAKEPADAQCMSELAATAPLTISGVSRLVGRLEQAGWVRRVANPRDARFAWATLTSDGLALAHAAHATYTSVVRRYFLDNLHEQDVESLITCWRRIGAL